MAPRELAERNSDGIVVQLFWDDSAQRGSDVLVEYRDERQEVFFTLYPPRDSALEAFYHPNAFARGAEYAWPELRAAARSAWQSGCM